MIVQENINFERGMEPKKNLNLGVYLPGRPFKYKNSYRPNFPSVFILVDSQDKKFRTYFYIGRFINPQNSLFGQDFSTSGSFDSDNSWNVQSKEDDKMEPLSFEEEKRLEKFIEDSDSSHFLKDIRRWSNVDLALRESVSFQRGLSDREIKDVLIGWKEGQFLINPHTNIVYVYLEEWEGENNIEIFSIGHLRLNPTKKTFFQNYKKNTEEDWARTNFKPKRNLRPLTNEEWKLVKPTLSPEYINKLESNFGVKVIIP